MSVSLAVKYRPTRFADVVGQKHVVSVLSSAAARQRPAQQILLAGPSGLGKTTTARIFAAALLCEHRSADGDCCGLCRSCSEIVGPQNEHPDVMELDAASNGGKDEIRELAARATLAPLRGRWKIYIVDEAHGLTGPGGQAFLRLLEEPPGHCLFILATTDPDKLPAALRGRCVTLEVLPPRREELLANLFRVAAGEDWELSQDVAGAVLAASDSSLGVRGTVTTLEKIAGLLEAGENDPEALQAVLGVSSAAELERLTTAIGKGDVSGAVAAFVVLDGGPGQVHLRDQLTQWAYGQLRQRVAEGGDCQRQLHWFETFTQVGDFPGGMLLAVAYAARGASHHSPASDVEPPQMGVDGMQGSQPKVEPAVVSADRLAADPAGSGGGGQRVVLASNSPEVVQLLNHVGKQAASAAMVLRRCEFSLVGEVLHVAVPPELVERAHEAGMVTALHGQEVEVHGL